MRKIFSLLFIFLFSLNGFGQKKIPTDFFDHIDITSYFYFDDVQDSTGTWRHFIGNKRNTSLYNFDSLTNYGFRTHYYFKINGGSGILVRLQKTLANDAPGKWINKKLEWRNGIGYRFFAMSSEPYTNNNSFPGDTTKIYPQQSVFFRLTQHYVDLQSSIVYKFPPIRRDRAFFLFGAGLQYSLSVQSKIKEKFTGSQMKWNTTTRRWDTDTVATSNDKFSTGNSSHLYLLIPMGMELKFSEYFITQFETTYFYHFRNRLWPRERYSEGAFFSFTMRFML